MSHKQVAVALLLFIGLTAMIAAAQRHAPGTVPHQEGAGSTAIEAVQDFLGLTEAQVAAWKELQATRSSVKKEQFSEVRDLEEQLQEELNSDSPSPDTVGRLSIRLHQSGQSRAQSFEAFTEQVRAILTADQLAKLQQVEESFGTRKLAEALIRTGFLAPPPPPPPPPPHAPFAPVPPPAPPPPPPPYDE
jgi:Spy/CpxP family protein refolding chaperone